MKLMKTVLLAVILALTLAAGIAPSASAKVLLPGAVSAGTVGRIVTTSTVPHRHCTAWVYWGHWSQWDSRYQRYYPWRSPYWCSRWVDDTEDYGGELPDPYGGYPPLH